jgi:hypothetical protein
MSSLRVATISVPHSAVTETAPDLHDIPGEHVVYVLSVKPQYGRQLTDFEVLLERDDLEKVGSPLPSGLLRD